MTIDEIPRKPKNIDDDGSNFVANDDAVSMIRAASNSTEESAATANYIHRAEDDTSDFCETEANPLLAGIDSQRAVVMIDTSIVEKPKRMGGVVEATRTSDRSQRQRVDEDGSFCENESMATANQAYGPPDGGLRAWMIMIGSFTINGILFSIINTYSLIYLELQKRLTDVGESEVSSKAGKKFFDIDTGFPSTRANFIRKIPSTSRDSKFNLDRYFRRLKKEP